MIKRGDMPNPNWWWVENIFTMICMTAIVLGLYFMGAGGLSFWGFILFLTLNSVPNCAKLERTGGN